MATNVSATFEVTGWDERPLDETEDAAKWTAVECDEVLRWGHRRDRRTRVPDGLRGGRISDVRRARAMQGPCRRAGREHSCCSTSAASRTARQRET